MLYRVRPDVTWLLLVFMFARVDAADAPVTGKHVARAAFTTQIVNREPVDEVLVLAPPLASVYFFTDLRNLQGHTVTHRWQFKGETVSQVPFTVEGDRWRVYSKLALPPGSYGEWSVTVVEDSGWPLYVELFRYEPVDTGAQRHETLFSDDPEEVTSEAPPPAFPGLPAASELLSE